MAIAATQKIWDDFAAQVYGYLLKRVKDSQTAKDLRQEVFVRIHQKLATLREEKNLRAWIFRITHHTLMDHFRQTQKRGEDSLPDEAVMAAEEEKGDMRSCLKPFIRRLPEPYRQTIVQAELEDKRYQDIADEAGVGLSAIKTRVQRGREMIKDMFRECCHFSADANGKLKGEHKDPENCTLCK